MPEWLEISRALSFGQAPGWNQVWGSEPRRPVLHICKSPKLGSPCSTALSITQAQPYANPLQESRIHTCGRLSGRVPLMSATPAGQAMPAAVSKCT